MISPWLRDTCNRPRLRARWLTTLTAAAVSLPSVALAQRPAPYSFVLDLAGTPVGEIPTSIKQLKGILEVVRKDGAPMLKASAASEFLITLPQVLPADFTLEFELVPKACCNPQDLSFEGTPAINQGPASAHILWDSDGYLAVIGGGEAYEAQMPEEFRATLPGVLTQVVAAFEGTTVRLYTNGRRLYTLTDRKFVRGRVLRVFLGGQDDATQAVYLAGLRIRAGTGELGIVAAQAGVPARPGAAGEQTASGTQSSTGTTTQSPQVSAVGGRTPATTQPGASVTPRASGGAVATSPVTAPAPPPATGPDLSRTITLPGFAAAGSFTTLAPRIITVSGFSATGGSATLAARTITLTGFTAAGGSTSLAPKAITLAGFTATGGYTVLPPKTITLSGFTAAGGYTALAPRTITLPGFSATGTFITLPPRTITLTGWTAAGTNP